MDIKEQINSIKEYFLNFNINGSVAYVMAKFPSGWKLPDTDALAEEYSVKITNDSKGLYFYDNIENGIDNIFEAVKYVISFNKEVEERMILFNSKIQELKEIFGREPIEKLRMLTFLFNEPVSQAPDTPKKNTKSGINSKKASPKTEEKVEKNKNDKPTEGKSTMMDLAETMVGE